MTLQAVMNITGQAAIQSKWFLMHSMIRMFKPLLKFNNYFRKSVDFNHSINGDPNDADESSEGEDILEAKTPVAQVYKDPYKPISPSPLTKPTSLSSSRQVNPSLASRDGSVMDLAVPFGDPMRKWQDSKQNLLIFGPSNYDKTQHPPFERDDTQSVSTVSGSGMDFFRKFVQRKGPKIEEPNDTKDCKECEDQFRREVLIDRLVSDALQVKAQGSSSKSSSQRTSESSGDSSIVKLVVPAVYDKDHVEDDTKSGLVLRALESSCSSGKCVAHRNVPETDLRSLSSSVSHSTVSGSGLLFLRNYLKKKNKPKPANECLETNDNTLIDDQQNSEATMLCDTYQPLVFNTVPIPFPPKDDFYGPAQYIPDELAFCYSDDQESNRRNSVGSTIADLLNDNFDSEDSELKNLDWEEWEEEDQRSDVATDIESDDVSIVVDILDMAKPVMPETRTQSSATTDDYSFETETPCSEPTFEELQNIKVDVKKKKLTIPFLDLPSPPSTSSSGSITPTIEDYSSRSVLSTPRQEEFSDSSYSFYGDTSASCSHSTSQQPIFDKDYLHSEETSDMDGGEQAQPSKKRLAEFWERRVSGNFETTIPPSTTLPQYQKLIGATASVESISKFKPAVPSYYDPEGNRKANEKIQRFLHATRKAADDNGVSVWSSNYDKLKRGELLLDKNQNPG